MNTKAKTSAKKALKPVREITPKQLVEKRYGRANSKIQHLQTDACKNKMVVAEAYHTIASGVGMNKKQAIGKMNTLTVLINKKADDGAYLGLIKEDGQSLKKNDSYAEGKFDWCYDKDKEPTSFTRELKVQELLKTEWAIQTHAYLAKITESKQTLTKIASAFAKRFK